MVGGRVGGVMECKWEERESQVCGRQENKKKMQTDAHQPLRRTNVNQPTVAGIHDLMVSGMMMRLCRHSIVALDLAPCPTSPVRAT